MTVIVAEQEANQSADGVKMIIQCRTLLQDVDFGVIPVPILGDAALWLVSAGHWLVPPFKTHKFWMLFQARSETDDHN